MTYEEISYLESEEGRGEVARNLGRDPLDIALDKKLGRARLIASQVKYLARARRKLPSYYEAGCIIPPLAFEQSSGEAAAAMKHYSGTLCVDLTCGLGVDSLNFSKRFDKVVAVERDEALCRIAKINFERLGARNIEVMNSSAEDFISELTRNDIKPDLIYVDPDRRPDAGKKQVRLQDCTPDVVALLPEMKLLAAAIIIKTSPLFDVDEAFRIFPGCRAEAVSAGGECKEVLIECGENTEQEIGAAIAGWGKISYPYPVAAAVTTEFTPPYDRMIIPDAALRKARISAKYFSESFPGSYSPSADGYVFLRGNLIRNANAGSEKIPGKVFEIHSMSPYRPGELREKLARRGIKSADVYLHGFPFSAGKICGDLKIREGGTAKLAFTVIGGGLWAAELK